MKDIAEVFEDFKRSSSLEDCEDSLKEIIVRKILSKRNFNASSSLDHKEDKNINPFNSSIVLSQKFLKEYNSSK